MKRSPLRGTSTDPHKKALHALDRAFSKMILERDKDEPCITCSKTQSNVWHCGHFRRRGFMSTRFNPRNGNKQCPGCNTFNYGKEYEYGLALDRKYMEGTAKILFDTSKQTKQWTITELEQLTDAAKRGYPIYVQLYNELMPTRFKAARLITAA